MSVLIIIIIMRSAHIEITESQTEYREAHEVHYKGSRSEYQATRPFEANKCTLECKRRSDSTAVVGSHRVRRSFLKDPVLHSWSASRYYLINRACKRPCTNLAQKKKRHDLTKHLGIKIKSETGSLRRKASPRGFGRL